MDKVVVECAHLSISQATISRGIYDWLHFYVTRLHRERAPSSSFSVVRLVKNMHIARMSCVQVQCIRHSGSVQRRFVYNRVPMCIYCFCLLHMGFCASVYIVRLESRTGRVCHGAVYVCSVMAWGIYICIHSTICLLCNGVGYQWMCLSYFCALLSQKYRCKSRTIVGVGERRKYCDWQKLSIFKHFVTVLRSRLCVEWCFILWITNHDSNQDLCIYNDCSSS